MNLQLVKSFLKHLVKAKTRHGVHSPFVYKLIDEVIYDFEPKKIYEPVELLRKELLADNREISITDLGAGSHVNNNKKKAVNELAKNALKPPRLAQLIYRLVRAIKPVKSIELGTCLGITSAYIANANSASKLITVEGCPQTATVARENLNKLEIKNVELKVGNFDVLLPEILNENDRIDFAFIDGNHRKEATLNYFNLLLAKVTEESLLIFDDIYWSRGMEEAWEQIKRHPKVTVTVDLFWIGLVFFKKNRAKEHFKVKY
jgi:predicted O-methyltransferase YrrM